MLQKQLTPDKILNFTDLVLRLAQDRQIGKSIKPLIVRTVWKDLNKQIDQSRQSTNSRFDFTP